ncbi:MAG: hypothetical protein EBU88_18145, partial [Acidobacteria bacterium]|nr:hypothetical protein [Acidobacteriota bacterium]
MAPEDFPKLEGTLEALASLATAEAVPFAVSFATAQALRPADAKANFPQPLETWIHGILLTALSPEEQPATTTAALAALREIAGDWKIEAIRTVLRDPSQPARLRVAALEALGGTSALFEDCRSILTSSTETSLRLKAASLLGQRHNDPVVQSALLEALPTAPLDVATEIATALAQSDAGASLLFEAIESHRTPARLLRQRAVARA